MRIGYIRATPNTTAEKQHEVLCSAGCEKIYQEAVNNLDYHRSEKLTEVIESSRSGDTLTVTKLSIISSTLQHLLEIMYQLEDKDVNLEAIQQDFNSSEDITLDEMVLQLMEFLEDIRKEKQAIGIIKAKENGVKLGRPVKMTKQKMKQALFLKQYHTSKVVANKLGVGKSTLLRHLAQMKKAG